MTRDAGIEPRRRPGIRAVARHAGVSLGTVSAVLNEKASVSPEVRDRVERAMRELMYVRPDGLPRKEGMMGLLTPDVRNPIFPLLSVVVSDIASRAGYTTVIHSTDPFGTNESLAERERAGMHHLLDRGITGMILLSGEAPDMNGSHEHFAQLSDLGAQMVLVNAPNDTLDIPCVGVDERAAGILAAEHLVSLGHKRIGVIGGVESFLHVRQRLQGVEDTLERHGLTLDPAHIVHCGWAAPDGFDGFRRILALDVDRRPTGLIAASDFLAFGVMRAAADAGLRLPRDLSIVGFDGIEACEYSLPRLTTIAQPITDIAATSVRILAELLAGESGDTRSVMFRPRLITRESTAAPGSK
jgi:LacI family repressor for deo operon, udp, cdd, tsx, nupC, and nupG